MKTLISVKVDSEVKEGAVQTAKEMALPLSTIINAFLKKFISDRKITFIAPSTPSKKLQRVLRQGEKDIKAGKNMSPLFTNMDEMDAYLRNL